MRNAGRSASHHGRTPPTTAKAPLRGAGQQAASDEIAKLVSRSGGRLAVGKIIHGVSQGAKLTIMRSGLGLEGFVRQFEDRFDILVDRGEKRVTLKNEADAAPPPAEAEAPSAGEEAPAAPPLPEADARAQPAAVADEDVTSDTVTAATKDENATAGSESGNPQQASESVEATPADVATENPAANEAASKPAEEADAEDDDPDADPAFAGLDAAMAKDPDDPNLETRRRVLQLARRAHTWYNLNDIYQTIYRNQTAVAYSDFVLYIRGSPDYFWYHRGAVSRKAPGQTEAPPKEPHRIVSRENIKRGLVLADGTPNPNAQAPEEGSESQPAPKGSAVEDKVFGPTVSKASRAFFGGASEAGKHVGLHQPPTAANNYGGWGNSFQVPTSADVFEILKYIPVHWVNFGNITIPSEIKKRHVRTSSALTWYARQPRYFDLRVTGGTIEIRRSVVMHPDAHNMSKEEAEKHVQTRIDADVEAGEPIPMKLARLVGSDGMPKAGAQSGGTKLEEVLRVTNQGGSAMHDAVTKILLRVCPGYFISTAALQMRATRKMELIDIITAADGAKSHIDVLTVTSTANAKVNKTFLRRKTGIEASKWEADFVTELENSPNLSHLTECMTYSCAQWDRLHFLYVRLPDGTKTGLGGFDGMVEFLRAHPHVFLVGEYFVKRIDPSDPSFDAVEPDSNHVTSTKLLEDNPYHQSKELAKVFHYLTPEDQPCALSHFVECASPAMKSVIPPRLITIVQSHPELLSYREVSPGTYAISRALEDGGEGASVMPADETVQEVMKHVPPRGIDAAHLMNSLPPQLHAAVVRHFGREGISELVTRNMHLFHVVRNPPYTTLFLKRPKRSSTQ